MLHVWLSDAHENLPTKKNVRTLRSIKRILKGVHSCVFHFQVFFQAWGDDQEQWFKPVKVDIMGKQGQLGVKMVGDFGCPLPQPYHQIHCLPFTTMLSTTGSCVLWTLLSRLLYPLASILVWLKRVTHRKIGTWKEKY